MTRVLVAYHSRHGTMHELAVAAAQAARRYGAQVRLRRVPADPGETVVCTARPVAEAAAADLVWSDAVVLGSPTHFGNVTASFKRFVDSTSTQWSAGALRGRVVAAMSSSQRLHGGRESTLLAIHRSAYHWGAIVVPASRGLAGAIGDGYPYGVSVSARNGAEQNPMDTSAVAPLVDDVVRVASALGRPRRSRPVRIAIVLERPDRSLAILTDAFAGSAAAAGAQVRVSGGRDLEALAGWADGVALAGPADLGLPAAGLVAALSDAAAARDHLLRGIPVTGLIGLPGGATGAESALLAMYAAAMHAGAVIVPTGRSPEPLPDAGGNPYGCAVHADADPAMHAAAAAHAGQQATRLVRIAGKLSEEGRHDTAADPTAVRRDRHRLRTG